MHEDAFWGQSDRNGERGGGELRELAEIQHRLLCLEGRERLGGCRQSAAIHKFGRYGCTLRTWSLSLSTRGKHFFISCCCLSPPPHQQPSLPRCASFALDPKLKSARRQGQNKEWEPEVKRGFLTKVYSIVTCQLAVTVAFCALAMYVKPHPREQNPVLNPREISPYIDPRRASDLAPAKAVHTPQTSQTTNPNPKDKLQTPDFSLENLYAMRTPEQQRSLLPPSSRHAASSSTRTLDPQCAHYSQVLRARQDRIARHHDVWLRGPSTPPHPHHRLPRRSSLLQEQLPLELSDTVPPISKCSSSSPSLNAPPHPNL